MALAFGVSLLTVLLTWRRGRTSLPDRWHSDSTPLASVLARLPRSRTHRAQGLAEFMTGDQGRVPGPRSRHQPKKVSSRVMPE